MNNGWGPPMGPPMGGKGMPPMMGGMPGMMPGMMGMMALAPAPVDDTEELLMAQPQFMQDPTDQHGKRRQNGPIAIGFEGAFAGLKDCTGTVREWVEKGGYGFIKPDNEQLPDLFVHRTSMVGSASAMATGDRVTFDTAQDLKSGRLRAENVRGGSGIGHKDTRSYKQRTAEEANIAEETSGPQWLAKKAAKEKADREALGAKGGLA